MNTKDHEIYRSGVGTLRYLTRHQQSSNSVIKDHGCTSPSTFERNVQAYQVCIVNKRLWTEIQTDQEHKKMGTESTK